MSKHNNCSHGNKLPNGKKSLAETHPAVASQAYQWDPRLVTAGSGLKKSWICKEGHVYENTVGHRAKRGQGCPFCSGKKAIPGVADLPTLFPEISKEAYKWSPVGVHAGSYFRKKWICKNGHIFQNSVKNRTFRGQGCPVCSGKKRVQGVNDLPSLFPHISKQAYKWNPIGVNPGSKEKKSWICEKGHLYKTTVQHRAIRGQGCPFCSGRKKIEGVNDLVAKFPQISREAYKWSPVGVSPGSHEKKQWICSKGHVYKMTVKHRAIRGQGCPYCSGKIPVHGVTDLATKFPKIAKLAYKWNPSEYLPQSNKRKEWRCSLGHVTVSQISMKVKRSGGCPVCSNQICKKGVNDMASTHKHLACELVGDPTKVVAGTNKRLQWKCAMGHTWWATGNSRANAKTGCPRCADYCFKFEKSSFFYLVRKSDRFKFGIGNHGSGRLKIHRRSGWELIESIDMIGHAANALEDACIAAFKSNGIPLGQFSESFDGRTESWRRSDLSVRTIRGLCRKLRINLNAFLAM